MSKKIIGMVIITCLLAGLFTGFTAPKTQNLKELVIKSARVIQNGTELPKTKNNLCYQELYKKFKIKFVEKLYPEASQTEQIMLMFATNDYPEFLWGVQKDIVARLKAENFLIPMSDYFNKLPNVKKLYTDDEWDTFLRLEKGLNGKIYYVPLKNYRSHSQGWVFNKAYLNDCGISDFPKTTDDLYAALKKMKSAKPETTLVNLWGIQYFIAPYALAFRTSDGLYLDMDTGKLTYGPTSDKMRDALKYAKKLYTENLVVKDLATMTYEQFQVPFSKGQVPVLYFYVNVYKSLNETLDKYPKREWQWSKEQITAYPGKPALVVRETPFFTSGPVITDKASKDKIDRLLQLIDFAATDEGQIFNTYGVKGMSYDVVDGKYLYKGKYAGKGDPKYSGKSPMGTGESLEWYKLGFPMYWIVYANEKMKEDPLKVYSNDMKNAPYFKAVAYRYMGDTEKESTSLQTALDDIKGKYYLMFITKDLDPAKDSDWKKYLDEMKKAGLDRYTNITQEAYKRAGN